MQMFLNVDIKTKRLFRQELIDTQEELEALIDPQPLFN